MSQNTGWVTSSHTRWVSRAARAAQPSQQTSAARIGEAAAAAAMAAGRHCSSPRVSLSDLSFQCSIVGRAQAKALRPSRHTQKFKPGRAINRPAGASE